jgi:signal transduction histidine kinase
MKFASVLTSSPRRRVVLTILVANLLAYGLIAISLETSYRQHNERAAVASFNTNRLVAQNISDTFERVDLALRSVRDGIAQLRRQNRATPQEIEGFVRNLDALLPMTSGFRVTDVSGNLIASSRDVPAGVSYADRDYFQQLRDGAVSDFVISKPVMGHIGKKWAIAFARKLEEKKGGFQGIVVTSIQIEQFNKEFSELNVGQRGTVVLRGDASRDFDLLARYPEAGFVGQTKVSDKFRATITANPALGTYQAYAGADNILRTFSYQAVKGFPLITLVGLAPEDYLVSWWHELYKMVSLALAFTLFSLIGGLALLRTWRNLERKTEELARSNADLEQFAYIASHDLQTPLRNIVSFTQLLERRYRDHLDADANEFLGYIVDGAKRMSQMVVDLLEYARISNKTHAGEPVNLDLAVRTALRDLSPLIAQAGVAVEVGDLPVVHAEARKIESLFLNLIENAIKYRGAGGEPRIDISAEPDENGFWRISVKDNGIGIAKEYLDKIFVIFQRLDPQRYPEGTGIGLAICRRIVERFGGHIWVESEPGKGTVFYFTLPRLPATPGVLGSVEYQHTSATPAILASGQERKAMRTERP